MEYGLCYIMRCSSSSLSFLIASAVMQSCMSMHASILLMVMCMPGISSFPFVLWFCLDSQFAMNSCSLVYIVF